LDELLVVTRAEELTIFLIGFNFGYLSDLVDSMKVRVFEVFKFEIVESVLFLDRLHLVEN